jgi:gliding motility-associated protein GldM
VAALASLSSMQKEILTARADAVSLIRQRVGGGEYAFNSIMAIAHGPEVANAGEEIDLQVLMVAYDSDKQPVVKMNGAELPKDQIHDGKGYINVKGSGSEMKLSGTITILNKSGIPKTLPWEKTVKIMKPQGTISLPGMNVLYRNYDNIVEGVASGYDETVLNGSDVSLRKSGSQYIALVSGTGRTASISISGRNNVTHKTESLGVFKFRVSNLPKPSLYFGTLENGASASPTTAGSMNALFMKYPPEIPLNVTFDVASWEMTLSNNSGLSKQIQGFGNKLSDPAKALLKQARPGTTITFTAKFKGRSSGFSGCTIKVI